MTKAVNPIPDDRHGVTPYLHVRGAASAIEFYAQAFGAVEVMRMAEPSGTVGHAELRIGGGTIFLSDEYPDMSVRGPQTLGGSPVTLHLYVDDVDAVAARAVQAGAKVVRPIEDQFYGDRAGKLEDPFGHVWWLATHKEDVPPDEMHKRAAALFGAG